MRRLVQKSLPKGTIRNLIYPCHSGGFRDNWSTYCLSILFIKPSLPRAMTLIAFGGLALEWQLKQANITINYTESRYLNRSFFKLIYTYNFCILLTRQLRVERISLEELIGRTFICLSCRRLTSSEPWDSIDETITRWSGSESSIPRTRDTWSMNNFFDWKTSIESVRSYK